MIIEKIFSRKRTLLSLLTLFLLLFSVSTLNSCQKPRSLPESPISGPATVVIDKQSVSLMAGETVVLNLSQENGDKFVKPFEYSISDPKLATITRTSAYSISVRALRKGTAVIKFVSDAGDQELTATININELPSDNITRILAIGNSFSEDAIENYLHSMITAAGDSVIIANLYIGGSSLQDHLTNAKENKSVYSYRKIGTNGVKVTTENVSIERAITDERWNYISFQQVSQNSGQFNTYQNTLPELLSYVQNRVFYSKTKYVLHQTWAYAQNSTHNGFNNYERDQLTMYNAIVDAADRASKLVSIDVVVPSGTAIQNGRTTFWGDNFNRDGYHLDLNVGRYLAACTWYKALFDKPVVGNLFNPGLFSLSPIEMEMAQHAARAAVLNPKTITDMTAYKTISSAAFVNPIFVDVAQSAPVFGWNGLTSPVEGTTIPFLRDQNGNLTKISLTIIERFNNSNPDGVQNTATPFNMPAAVSRISYYGNSKAAFLGLLVKQSVLRIANLDPAKSYNFCYFGSRGGTTETRQTKYIAKGQNEVVAYLNTGNNGTNIACTNGVKPNANGVIDITITAGESNDNSTGFYYLNAMRITPQ